jgi:hypothetical protein
VQSNKRVTCQIVHATIAGDVCVAAAYSSELVDFCMPRAGLNNYAAGASRFARVPAGGSKLVERAAKTLLSTRSTSFVAHALTTHVRFAPNSVLHRPAGCSPRAEQVQPG